MRYNRDKCLNFLQNDKKKSISGRIPIYVGDKTNSKEPFREGNGDIHMSPPSVRHPVEIDDLLLPEEESLADRDNTEHDFSHDANYSEDKATKQTRTTTGAKSVKSKLEHGKQFKSTSQTTNKGKSSMIPKSTQRFRSKKGSKQRAAALVDELSRSVEDISPAEPTSSKIDETRLTKTSKFSKSCGHLDNNAELEEEFAHGNWDENVEEVPLKADSNKKDKFLIGTRKAGKQRKVVGNAMDATNVESKVTETDGGQYGNEEKETRAAIYEEKSKQKHPIINNKTNTSVQVTNSDPDNQFATEHKNNYVRATTTSEHTDIDNNRPSIQGEQKRTQPPRDRKKLTKKTGSKGFKLNELSDHEHRIVAEESDAIIAEIKLKNKVGRKRENMPITAKKVDMEEQDKNTSSDSSAVESRSAENQDSFFDEKTTSQRKSIGGTGIKKKEAPMIYNEIKMNTFNKNVLSKSIDGMVALNEAMSNQERKDSPQYYNSEKGRNINRTKERRDNEGNYAQYKYNDDINNERRNLYPKLNLSLNFDDSHQSSPLNSSNGFLEMSSGLEANTTRSNYNFHISLDESQELSQSVNLIRNKIFNDKDEWDGSRTNGRLLKHDKNESEGTSSLSNLLSRRNVNKSQEIDVATETKHQKLDNLVHTETEENDDVFSQSSVHSDTRNGASSSCSLLYTKDMGLICKKCFDSSCYHMEQVNDLKSLTAESTASKENTATTFLGSKQQESMKLGEIDESKSSFNKHNILGYEHRRATRNSSLSSNITSNIHNISESNTKNVHLPDSYSTRGREYNIHSSSINQDDSQDRDQTNMYDSRRYKNPVPFSRQNKPNYPVEFLEKYNPELYYSNNNAPSFDSSVGNSNNDVNYLSNKIQDNRRTLNHLLRTTPTTTPASNISQDEEDSATPHRSPAPFAAPATSSSANEPETPKTRRSNSIMAASDLETVFEVDERATSMTPKLSTGKHSYGKCSKNESPHGDDGNDEHVPPPALPQYDKKDQILQLLDQARSILNLKKRKTSQDCDINTDRIYAKNMMKANSAISSSTISPQKKPKTATGYSHSLLHTEDIVKSKSAPELSERGTRDARKSSNYESKITNQEIDKKDYAASEESLDGPLNLDLWVNVSSNSSVGEPISDSKNISEKRSFKPSNVFVLNTTVSAKQNTTSQNCTPSPGDSGIELNNSNSNSHNSTQRDPKRDVKALHKDKKLLSNSGVHTETSVASTPQRHTTYTRDNLIPSKFSHLDPRTLNKLEPTRDRYKDPTLQQRHLLSDRTNIDDVDRYKDATTIHQRYLSDRTNIEHGGIRRTYKPPLLSPSSRPSLPTMPRNSFTISSRNASDTTEQPNYIEPGVFIESDTWPRNYYESPTKNKYKFEEALINLGDTPRNQRGNIYSDETSLYSRSYSKSLPSLPPHERRYSTENKPLQTASSYRLSNHIISSTSRDQPGNRSERIPSIVPGSHRNDFIDYSTTTANISHYRI